jgi:hypothetical protein
MIGLLCFVVAVLASPFKSKIRLEAENAAPRHQLVVLRRKPILAVLRGSEAIGGGNKQDRSLSRDQASGAKTPRDFSISQLTLEADLGQRGQTAGSLTPLVGS